METQSDGKEDTVVSIKDKRQRLETRIVVCSFNGRPFFSTPLAPPSTNPNSKVSVQSTRISSPETARRGGSVEPKPAVSNDVSGDGAEKFTIDESGSPLSVVRSMVAVCLLERVPFTAIDSSAVLRKLENDTSATAAEKAALREMGGESGADSGGGDGVEGYGFGIDRTRLVKELPESAQYQQQQESSSDGNQNQSLQRGGGGDVNSGGFGMGGLFLGQCQTCGWDRGCPFIRLASDVSRRRRARPPLGPNMGMSGPNATPMKPRTEEDDLKDLEALLNKKSFREMQKSKTGEELLDLIHRPTARETAVAAKFKTKGGSQLKEYCSALTKRIVDASLVPILHVKRSASGTVHFRRIIAPHTDINLGDCSFLDTCRHMKNGYSRQFGVIMADPPWDIHMELPYGTMADDEMRSLNVPALQTDGLIFLWVTGRAMELGRECLELWGYKRVEEIIWVKTNQLQRIIRTGRTGHWLNHSKEHCLVGIKGNPEVNRNIDTDVIVAEVRETSRKPDEVSMTMPFSLSTYHKKLCHLSLRVNLFIPLLMYPMLERISPRTRKLELFARMHNTHAGLLVLPGIHNVIGWWMSLGNQLNGVRLVDEGLRARFKAAYPEVEVQPTSPPRTSAMELDSNTAQIRSPFPGMESKSTAAQFAEPTAPEAAYPSEEKSITLDVEMMS
ncbi:N6-adenosine-methyltransferase MT-A70-like [Vitis vinifera]|uniref:N6-adenosine-methyltransferase MT-A70-like n=1 Tax=Vitis vinifera TaxID=29760 RepID=A0A438I4Q8_VITVI|nr:N6-adenosine-methyltransferase MT-A70-like [Vitis vinifera]